MSIVQRQCWFVVCDRCLNVQDDEFVQHFDRREDAKESLTSMDSEWETWKDAVWCVDCVPLCVCGCSSGEHDYGESPCENNDGCQEFSPTL